MMISAFPSRVIRCLAAASLVWMLAGCGGASTSSGSTNNNPAQPTTLATTTALAVSPNPAPANTAVLLVATVTASGGTPTGIVTFLDGTTTLGSGALTNGVLSLSVTTFAPGTTHSLTASYAGQTGFAAGVSPVTSLVVQAVTAPVTITAHGTFTFTTANQTIAGFGGSEAFYLSYLDSHPNQAQIYTALFDPVKGLGLTFLRVQNLYQNYTGYNATTFDVDTPAVVKAANLAHGTPLTVLMSSWSPPAAIKSNASVNNGGTLNMISGGYNYAGFGQYWYNSLNAYAALGVTPSYISIQNEPDYTATYASCRFNPTEATYNGTNYAGYGLAFQAVYQQTRALATPPAMVGPETFSTINFTDMAAQIPTSEVGAYAHHLYNVSSTSTNPDTGLTGLTNLNLAYPTQMKFETEYYASPAINDAWDIHNALTVGNDNAYFYWGLAWPSSTVTNGQATDEQGLIYIDNPGSPLTWQFTAGWSYNDAYYALKHFSYYVRPGYIRYNASVDNADERVSVYQSADTKTTVIVAMNLSATATDGLSLALSGVNYTASTVYRSTFSTPILTGERWANLGPYSTGGLSLPPQSVATIVLTR